MIQRAFITAWRAVAPWPYYVALLSAAALHGAAHQQPQEFQVVTDRLFRPARAGRGRLRFFLKRHFARTPTVDVRTETGTMRVSSPEATVFDLVRYVDGAGGLGNIATVLSDLGAKLDPERLVEAAQADVELSFVQRTGHLLEATGAPRRVTDRLATWLADQRPRVTSLRPDRVPKAVVSFHNLCRSGFLISDVECLPGEPEVEFDVMQLRPLSETPAFVEKVIAVSRELKLDPVDVFLWLCMDHLRVVDAAGASSQQKLADRVGVSKETVARILKNPEFGAVAKRFGISRVPLPARTKRSRS